MAAKDLLGKITCPICDGEAKVTESKRGSSTIYCPGCGFQGFARTPIADKALRGKIRLEPAPADKGGKDPNDIVGNL